MGSPMTTGNHQTRAGAQAHVPLEGPARKEREPAAQAAAVATSEGRAATPGEERCACKPYMYIAVARDCRRVARRLNSDAAEVLPTVPPSHPGGADGSTRSATRSRARDASCQ